jgi:RimJ/RimL family protein N-acetyltransferase
MLRRLHDGTSVLTRRIRPDDKRLIQRGIENLSELSVRRRFLSSRRKFTQAELRYLTEVDGRNHVAIVAESPTQPARRLIGVARFVRLQDDPDTAEVAIVVADDFQGRGVGSLLARELAARARGLGVKRFTATMAGDNRPALRLMEKLTQHLERHPAGRGTTDAVIDLAA